MDNELLELALEYLARGWSVIPVGKDKRPLIGWKKYQQEFATESQVREWFTETDAQIGIVTGKISNLTVVDLELGADASFLKGLETYIVQTGSGGFHYYFKNVPGVQNTVRSLPLVDTRSEGGYVVAGGSASEKGEYVVVDESEIIDMPDYVQKLLWPTAQEQKPFYPEEHITDYPGYGAGQRNNEMARYIGAVLRRMHPSMWQTVAWPLAAIANRRNTPPLSDAELKAVFDSISSRENSKPDSPYKLVSLNEDAPPVEIPEVTPEEVEQGIGHVYDVADRQPIDTDIFYPLNIDQFDRALDGGLSPGDLVILTGPTGNGKTSFAQDITMSFAKAVNPQASLWFSYEVMPRPLAKKFKTLGLDYADPVYMPFSTEERTVEGIGRWAEAAQKEKDIKLLVVDHLDFIYSEKADKRHNEASLIKAVCTELKALATRLGIVVILMSHINKEFVGGGTPDVRHLSSSSAQGQLADSVFFLERMKNSKDQSMSAYFSDDTKISMIKNRRTGQTPAVLCRFIDGRFVPNQTSQEMYDEFIENRRQTDAMWEEETRND